MISNLQALRAFAALAVVFYHTNYLINGAHTSFQGVALFFCISGFIMVYVSRQNTEDFLLRRIIRIVPVYWFATIACFFFVMFGLNNVPYVWPTLWGFATERPYGLVQWAYAHFGLTDSVKTEMLKSLFFVPYKNPQGDWMPVLSVGWTLNLEMFFYVLFAVALKISRTYAPLIVVGLLTVPKVLDRYGFGPYIEFYSHIYTLCFMYGIGCYYAWKTIPEAWCVRNRRPITLGAIVVGAVFIVRNIYPHSLPGPTGFVIDSILLSLTFLTVLVLHSAGVRVKSKTALLLGAASYSIYLFHLTVLATLQTIGQKWPLWNFSSSFVGMAAAMVLSALAGVVVYKLVEVPITRLLHGWLERRPTVSAIAPLSR